MGSRASRPIGNVVIVEYNGCILTLTEYTGRRYKHGIDIAPLRIMKYDLHHRRNHFRITNVRAVPPPLHVQNTIQPGITITDKHTACVVCLEYAADTIIDPCSHVCMCSSCSHKWCSTNRVCPICRTHVDNVIVIKPHALQQLCNVHPIDQ